MIYFSAEDIKHTRENTESVKHKRKQNVWGGWRTEVHIRKQYLRARAMP